MVWDPSVRRARERVETAAECGTLVEIEDLYDDFELRVLPHVTSAQCDLLQGYEDAISNARAALHRLEARVASRRVALEALRRPRTGQPATFPLDADLIRAVLAWIPSERARVAATRTAKAFLEARGAYEAGGPLWRRLTGIRVSIAEIPSLTVLRVAFDYSDGSSRTWGHDKGFAGWEENMMIAPDDELIAIECGDGRMTSRGAVLAGVAFLTRKGAAQTMGDGTRVRMRDWSAGDRQKAPAILSLLARWTYAGIQVEAFCGPPASGRLAPRREGYAYDASWLKNTAGGPEGRDVDCCGKPCADWIDRGFSRPPPDLPPRAKERLDKPIEDMLQEYGLAEYG